MSRMRESKGFPLLCHQSVRDSKLAVMLGKLDMPMTARNWKTLGKICEMLNE